MGASVIVAEATPRGATIERFNEIWRRGVPAEDDLGAPFAQPFPPSAIAPVDVFALCASEQPIEARCDAEEPDALRGNTPDWTVVHPAVPPGADVRFLVGHRGTTQMPVDPLAPHWLRRVVPDIEEADVMVCGSASFTRRVLGSLAALGVPSSQIHAERFGY